MEYTLPSATMFCMTLSVIICLAGPILYLVAIRKRLYLGAILLGLVAYAVFGHYGAGIIQGLILPDEGSTAVNPVSCALIAALSVTVLEEIGRYIVLGYGSNRYNELGAALSFGCGYSLIRVMLTGGANIAYEISVASMIKDGNIAEMVESLETQEETDALYELMETICTRRPADYLLGGLELAAFFALSVSLTVLVWYAVKHKAPMQNMLIPAAALHLLYELPDELYYAGASVSAEAMAAVSMLAAVAAVLLAVRTAKKLEPQRQVSDDPVNRSQTTWRKH